MRDGMKHIVDTYLGVAFWSGPDPVPVSTPLTLTMHLMYAPNVNYDQVVPGAEFTVREGSHIIGHGRVLRRYADGNTANPEVV